MTYITKNTFPTFEEIERINKAFSPFSIGLFDSLIDRQSRNLIDFQKSASGYPPYNILKKDDLYTISIAVAGFTKDSIEIEYFDKTLTIKGTPKQPEKSEGVEVIYGGIANRAFTRSFTLADNIEVVGADLKDGMLTIVCKQWIPERLQRRQIPITQNFEALGSGGDSQEPVLLNESETK